MQVRETTVDGRPIRYRVAGGGEPLVLVHGLAGSWRWWLPLVDLLRAQRRVHVVQLPRFRQHVAVTDVSGWLGRWADAAGNGGGGGPGPFAGSILRGTARCAAAAACAAARTRRTCRDSFRARRPRPRAAAARFALPGSSPPADGRCRRRADRRGPARARDRVRVTL